MTSSFSNGTSKWEHSANGTEYQFHESQKGYRAANNRQTGFNSPRYNGSASSKLDVNPLLQLITEILQVKLIYNSIYES